MGSGRMCAVGKRVVSSERVFGRYNVRPQVCVVLTQSADFFLQRAKDYDATHWTEFIAATALTASDAGRIQVVRDADEWRAWQIIGDSVRHVEVRALTVRVGNGTALCCRSVYTLVLRVCG